MIPKSDFPSAPSAPIYKDFLRFGLRMTTESSVFSAPSAPIYKDSLRIWSPNYPQIPISLGAFGAGFWCAEGAPATPT